MKPETEPLEFQKFDALVTGLLKVPHSEIKRKLDAHNRKRDRKRRAKALRASHGPAERA